jgi:hypothetical protein
VLDNAQRFTLRAAKIAGPVGPALMGAAQFSGFAVASAAFANSAYETVRAMPALAAHTSVNTAPVVGGIVAGTEIGKAIGQGFGALANGALAVKTLDNVRIVYKDYNVTSVRDFFAKMAA